LELDGVIFLFVLDLDDLLFYFAKHGWHRGAVAARCSGGGLAVG
jgi:hypothetical protein